MLLVPSGRPSPAKQESPMSRARGVLGSAAPLLGSDVPQRLGERPAVPREVLCLVLPLPVLEIHRLHEDSRTVRPGALAVGPGVAHTNHHGVGFLALARWAPVMTYIADDDGPIAEAELGAMALADPDALDKTERGFEPLHRFAHVRIHEHRDDRRRRDRTIALQGCGAYGLAASDRCVKSSSSSTNPRGSHVRAAASRCVCV